MAPQPAPARAPDPVPVIPYEPAGRVTRFRWVILFLVFLAITINYIDRMVLGVLAPDLRKEFNIDSRAYGHITAAFAWSYALGQSFSGRWLDWIGTRLGYAIALFAWSIAGMMHVLARSTGAFIAARAVFGVSQSPAFPAATKTLAEWFPKKERAFAFGFVNSGANAGAIIAPALISWIALATSWQWAFIIPGIAGLFWLALWLPLFRHPAAHSMVSSAELSHIQSDPPEETTKVRWAKLLTYRQTWAFAVGKFSTDPIWTFYLFWLPQFLRDRHNVNLAGLPLPMAVVYLIATVGSIGGGYLSSTLIRRGWSINAARKTALLVSALLIVPSVLVATIDSMWGAVFLSGLALAGHQSWSSNLYTTVPDMFPKQAVGSVAGFGGTWGYIGTTLFMTLTGYLLAWNNNSYTPIFIVCGSAYLLALLVIHLLVPRLEIARLEPPREPAFEVVRP